MRSHSKGKIISPAAASAMLNSPNPARPVRHLAHPPPSHESPLDKRPRVHAPSSLSLAQLPDRVLLRVYYFICTFPNRRSLPCTTRPYNPLNAYNLALCSHRFLQLFREGCIFRVDAVPDKQFLEPLARTDPRFGSREPCHLRALTRCAGASLRELHLPLYDCSMEDAQWSILKSVSEHCPNLETLSFVDSFRHTCTTAPRSQCAIFAKLLAAVQNLSVYIVRETSKLETMTRIAAFHPRTLVLHRVHPKLSGKVIALLTRQGSFLTSLTLSFDQIQPQHRKHSRKFELSFLALLSNAVAQHMHRLHSLHIRTGPHPNPLYALPGPGISTKASKNEFNAVVDAIMEAKKHQPVGKRSLQILALERFCPQMESAVSVFAPHCSARTQIETSLHEVLLVSPPQETAAHQSSDAMDTDVTYSHPYFCATKLHSSSWMIKELPPSYFRQIQHIHVGADEDSSNSVRSFYDRMLAQERLSVNPDMQSFRFLCEKSCNALKSVYASVPIASPSKGNDVLRVLSSGFGYAKGVTLLEISGDVLKYIGLGHSLLYSVVGQLRNLREMHVTEPTLEADRQAQIQNLPVLLRGLWMFCRKLESFKMEYSSFGTASSAACLQTTLNAVREFERQLPGVETYNLGVLLGIALKHCSRQERGSIEEDMITG